MYNSTLNKTIYKMLIYFHLVKTSLHWAASKGHTDIAKILLAHGANVSSKNNDGNKDTTYINMHIHIIHNH